MVFKMKNVGCACVFVLLSFQMGCIYSQRNQEDFDTMLKQLYKETVPLIYPREVKERGLSSFTILDIREEEEFRVSHLPNAKQVSYENFRPKFVKDIPKDKPVLVYCSVGKRSEDIGEKLSSMGFKEVRNLYGGIFQWKNEGNTVYNEQEVATDSVHTYNWLWSQWLLNGTKVY